ncbi:relaxase/mobilization nuclease domain-containing protein [Kitasatospora sp. NBC_00315]|uniref:relaxase/mobilization nuclease domain-containing protein n=1 Tax=Kitasatospora sp. NBC_00315 TaxID=2975963 RepID=UPI002F9198B2
MIAKITKGKSAGGAIRYDFGPGRRDEHLDPRVVAGTVPGTPQQIARIIDHHTRPSGIKTPIWRCSLSLPDQDGVLTDAKFAEIAEQYVQRMGYGGCPWVAVRHGLDHIHITVSRVGWDRRTVDDHGDYLKSMPIVRALEKEHGLVDAGALSNRRAPQVSGQERTASQRRGAVEPERLRIRAAAIEARDAAAGRGRAAFEQLLTEAGIDFRANESKTTGRMNGYSFSIPSWVDAEGAQIWVTASKTAKDLAWQKLEPVIRQAPASTAPPADRTGRTPLDGDQVEQAGRPERPEGRRPESIAPPVDPAAQLLAAVRAARAAEEDQGAEDVALPPYLDPEQTYTRRTHGLLRADQLLTTRAAAVKSIAARVDALNEVTATAMRFDGIASGVATGMDVAELHQRRERLQRAVGHLGEATAHQAQAEEHTGNATASRAVAQEATKKAGRSRLILAAMGTTKGAELGMAKAAREFAEQEERAAARAARAAELAKARAGAAAPDEQAPLAALERLTADWPKLEKAARRQDVDRAKVMKVEHLATVQQARAAVGAARQALADVDAEIAFRAALPPKVAETETRLRAEHEQRERASAARGRSTTTRSTPPKKSPPRPPTPQPAPRPRGHDPGKGKGIGGR